FQLARLDTLYVELEVAERDVHEILAAGEAVIAFASAPEREFNVSIEQVHPSAQSRPSGSVFLVRAKLPAEGQPWWRPGMTGAARIKVGWRNPLWILTHQTMDWLRLHWW
ncbi:MAG: HlyD family efflux transporter periplasmic adaptor subunit, partial [Chthoniobacteraceae bacterium]